MKTRLFFLFLISLSGTVSAASALFSIQIAATKSSSLSFYKQSTNFDSLYADTTNSALTKIKLGAYNSHEEAEKHLSKIRKSGFPDAFISPYTKQNSTSFSTNSELNKVVTSHNTNPLNHESSPAWQGLTHEQRRNTVYLDGVLHIREGDKFTPLTNY